MDAGAGCVSHAVEINVGGEYPRATGEKGVGQMQTDAAGAAGQPYHLLVHDHSPGSIAVMIGRPSGGQHGGRS